MKIKIDTIPLYVQGITFKGEFVREEKQTRITTIKGNKIRK